MQLQLYVDSDLKKTPLNSVKTVIEGIVYFDEQGRERDGELHVNVTHEGIIIDVCDSSRPAGEDVVYTRCMDVGEILAMLNPQED